MDISKLSLTSDKRKDERSMKDNSYKNHYSKKSGSYKRSDEHHKKARSSSRSTSRNRKRKRRSRSKKKYRRKDRKRSISSDKRNTSRDRTSLLKRSRKSKSKEKRKSRSKEKRKSRSTENKKNHSRETSRNSREKIRRKSSLQEKRSKRKKVSRSKENSYKRISNSKERFSESRRRSRDRREYFSRSRETSGSRKKEKVLKRKRRSRSRDRSHSHGKISYKGIDRNDENYSHREIERKKSRDENFNFNYEDKNHNYDKYMNKDYDHKSIEDQRSWEREVNGEKLIRYPERMFERRSEKSEETSRNTNYSQKVCSNLIMQTNNNNASLEFLNRNLKPLTNEIKNMPNINHEPQMKTYNFPYSQNTMLPNRATMPSNMMFPNLNQPPPGFVPLKNQTPKLLPLDKQLPFHQQIPSMIPTFPPSQDSFLNQAPLQPLSIALHRPQIPPISPSQTPPRFLMHSVGHLKPSLQNQLPQPFHLPSLHPNIHFPSQQRTPQFINSSEIHPLQAPFTNSISQSQQGLIQTNNANFQETSRNFFSPPSVVTSNSAYNSEDVIPDKDTLPPPPPPPQESHLQLTTKNNRTSINNNFTSLHENKVLKKVSCSDKYSPYSSTSEGSVEDSFANNLFEDSLSNINSDSPEIKNKDGGGMKDEQANTIIKNVNKNHVINPLKSMEGEVQNLVKSNTTQNDMKSNNLISLAKNFDLSGSLGIQFNDLKKVLETANNVTKHPSTIHHNKSKTDSVNAHKTPKVDLNDNQSIKFSLYVY